MMTPDVLGPEKFEEFKKKVEDLAKFLNSKNYGYYIKDGCIEDFDLRIWFDVCETKTEEVLMDDISRTNNQKSKED